MLSYETTRLLKTLLETISESEMIIERQRQTLCQHPKFAPYSAFCRIDRRARESLEPVDIQAYVQSNGSPSSIPECSKLVRYFDSDGDGILSYNDFIQMVLPCDNNEMRLMVQKRPYTRVGRFDTLEYEIECGLSSIVKQELDLIFRIETLIRDLERCPDFSPHAAFRAVDRYEEGKITREILIDFFRQFGNYLSEEEIYAIIRRIDTDGDAKIGFGEWCDFLSS
jgi:Ca2+-binding EF-hand superfamily protein